MELNEKIRALRQKKGMTQEELAAALYVSRAAVSKWESGRGYPSIDSLKAVAELFAVTVDDLLSDGKEMPADGGEKDRERGRLLDRVFGGIDLSALLMTVLPLFAQRTETAVQAVSLLQLTGAAPYAKPVCTVFMLLMAGMGVLLPALQTWRAKRWLRYKHMASLAVHALGVLLMVIMRQTYAAVFLFLLLGVKGLVMLKKA